MDINILLSADARLSSDAELEKNGLIRADRIASLYALVFSGPPWNEFTLSLDCDSYFGLDTKPGDTCANCGDILQLAYPIGETANKIRKEVSRPNGLLAILEKENNLVGFTWGFSYESSEQFAEDKYKVEIYQNNIVDLLKKSGVNKDFYYFSETGIAPEERGQNLSNILAKEIINKGYSLNLPVVMRTNWQSPMVAVARKFNMVQILGSIPLIDSMSKTIFNTGLTINGLDLENRDRVLFVSYPKP